MERFNPKPPFGETTSYTWALVHGTSVSGASSILLEGIIRPADWAHHEDPKRSQLPTFGLFGMSMQLNRGDSEIPQWVAQTLVDRAAKRAKGQQPVLVGAMYRGQHEHAALKAGGNDLVQLKVAQLGVATSSEKYVVAHSAHTQVRFIAVTWEELPTLENVASDGSDACDYRASERNWQAPTEPRERD